MTPEKIIGTFVDFYRERGHLLLPESSLVRPPDDPVLFTTSGMHPLTPYLEGRPHPLGRRLVNVQRCLRTTDLDEVGDPTHLTVFQMLGSWSLGDYDGPRSLRWGYDLLREGFGIDSDRLHATVFGGDEQVGPDTGSLEVWRELGVPVELTGPENWWSNGPTGPCGPDSEIFVWTGDTPPTGTPGTDGRWMEVWNHVQMRYHRHDDGHLSPLRQHNVDTGMGLERMEMVLRGGRSVFEGDGLRPWFRTVSGLWHLDEESLRRVCDHLRSSVVVLGDGVRPSNTGRGYVLRRLVRRTLTILWRDDPSRSLSDLPDEPFTRTLDRFGQGTDVGELRGLLLDEERRFRGLLRRGRPVVSRYRSRGPLSEEDYRYLHDTHGLPRDLVDGLLVETR
ncbi:alanine--tRNA ligase-related protein [Micromonospora sp. WMMD812]|uniref:alanine--tRNA ligase-related protein n=1 Tax=Micromonospora sp. WMMD812 TaxID=3015152 RepID=UPI00248C0493|nr:alanine--tRNA ligase-related protein [Micromonospora sp. WMMD812]WBB67883.1 alanine--tRNA ligase-related protein [Micromonospora sp. WMMD812]